MDLDSAIKNYVEFYTVKNKVYGLSDHHFYSAFDSPKQLIRRLIYVIDKILPVIKKYPALFQDKTLLDLGCGTGEHSYFLSHFCSNVDCFDPEPSHKKVLNNLFQNSNNFRVLEMDDYFFNTYDTILISGVLECIADYGQWFKEITSKVDCTNIILIFAPELQMKVDGHSRHYRMFDTSEDQTYILEDNLINFTNHLTLIDRLEFSTRENRVENHKKVIHIYKKN